MNDVSRKELGSDYPLVWTNTSIRWCTSPCDTRNSQDNCSSCKFYCKRVPQIDPDICIVNYYTNSGKLGLHQDKDESKSSINQGLAFISISIGDTAEFMFGDTRDKGKATKIDLESGDVLILGGESRLLFHGISHVKTNTTPTWLKEATGLRPGRINLTFRQY
ncbi:hypothetical protein U9M48_042832 [Paspalum notatum var. saurae]|uniref:Fe2OG dioxygenase domain-containing protein n=1 Tax=Paspalum notatum var. saurae TaxID=547442 RepID=A0AAQ3UTN2_PASNO